VKIDEEEWELSISGVVRPEDILPNNSVKSEKIAEKRIQRLSSGQGRDGVRRGWLQKIIDKFQPF
jgi:flagellar L-ring protein precursor FlgH